MRTRMKVVVTMTVLALAAVLFGGVADAALPAPTGSGVQRASMAKHHETLPPIDTSEAENCDFIADPGDALCMLPFPDDYYTVADPTSETGRRVDFKTAGMPANVLGEHIEAEPYNASDGFSPGSTILVKIPGIETAADVRAMGGVPINHISQYRRKNAPVAVIDAQTGQRWPIWTEIDSNAADHSKAVLEIHPAVNFTSGHRYIVVLRHLVNAAHEHLEAPAAFRYYRDDVPSEQEAINARRPHFEEIFSLLEGAGIHRANLYLAWDFTVASDANNTSRVLSMRNDAFAQLGDTNLADGIPEGVSPTFQSRASKRTRTPGRSRAGSRAASRFPASCSRAARRAGSSISTATATRSRTGPGRPTSIASSPTRWSADRPKQGGRRSTVTVCSATPRRSRRARSGACLRRTRSSSAPPTRSGWRNRTCRS